MKRLIPFLALVIVANCASRTAGPRTFALRLKPGEDLRQSLEQLANARQIKAGYVATCVGSLKQVAIRYADRKEPSTTAGPYEIVSLVGTLSSDGSHLHISVADRDGRMIGGHLAEGSIVYTTAEIVVVEIPGLLFKREIDPETTFRELKIHTF